MARPFQPKPGEPIREIALADGSKRYRVRLDAGINPKSGKRRQAITTHPSPQAARDHIAKHRLRLTTTPDRQTFKDYSEAWLRRQERRVGLPRGDNGLRPNTITLYCGALKHANNAFGSKRLSAITRNDVEAMVAVLHERGRSRRTVHLSVWLVRSILAEAEAERLIQFNPAKVVDAVGRPAKVRQALNPSDVSKVRAVLATDEWLHGAWCLTLLGLRRSEVLGLRWSDVDLKAGTVTIAQSRVSTNGRKFVIGEPKSKLSRRTLPLPSDVVAVLRSMRESQRDAFGVVAVRNGFVAVDQTGEPISPPKYSKAWRKACEAADVPVLTLHAARHSSVTNMIHAGISPFAVAAYHGHLPSESLDTYAHATIESLSEVSDALSNATSTV